MSKELEKLKKDVQVLYDIASEYCDLVDLNRTDTINCNKERLDKYFDKIQNASLSELNDIILPISEDTIAEWVTNHKKIQGEVWELVSNSYIPKEHYIIDLIYDNRDNDLAIKYIEQTLQRYKGLEEKIKLKYRYKAMLLNRKTGREVRELTKEISKLDDYIKFLLKEN